MAKEKRSKNQLRRERAKLRKVQGENNVTSEQTTTSVEINSTQQDKEQKAPVEPHENTENTPVHTNGALKEVPSVIDETIESNPLFSQFETVFNRFEEKQNEPEETTVVTTEPQELDNLFSDSSESESEAEQTISKTQLKKQNKIPLAILKASTSNPQLVDWYDADAADPYLLISLKLQPNSIQVPDHWSAKRDYLANRKGIERAPFKLPKFIEETGISEMRGSSEETLKQQQRARVQPKSGKLDIDFNKLHDAFFKYQTKPRLFAFGDVYFEGREDTDDLSEEVLNFKPGVISADLRKAVGMPENDFSLPPPWLAIMKQKGKPPTYKNLVIPGVDSPYANSGYREKGSKHKLGEEYWGKLQEFVESSEEEEQEEEIEEITEENGTEEPETANEARGSEDEPTKVSIDSYGASYNNTKATPVEDENKTLYTVLEEKKTENTLEGMLRTQFQYELQGNKDAVPEVAAEEEVQEVEEETVDTAEEQAKKFKF